jgi:glutamate synthase domain-containing protein 3
MKKDKHMFFLAVVILAGVFNITACSGNGDSGVGEPDAPQIDTIYVENRQLGISWIKVDNADSYNLYWNMTGGVSTSDNSITGIRASGSRVTYYHTGLSMFRAYSYMVTAENNAGESAPSNEVNAIPSNVPEELLKRIASDAEDGDTFSNSVAISGDTVVVGAVMEDGAGTDRGAAYIYDRNYGGPDVWGEVVILTASDAEDGDEFGFSVAISGDYVVVGAHKEDGAAGTDRGAAYIFARNQDGPDAWGEVAILTASDAQDGDNFGFKVAISGDYVVVGAHKEDGAAGTDRGAAYVFDRNSGGPDAWGEVAILTASDAEDGDEFGCSVAISGDFAVVGAHKEDGAAGTDRGAAYVFDRNSGGPDAWGEVVILTASDAEDGDEFGCSVSIGGDFVVVGADHEDGAGTDSGAAYIFDRNQDGPDAWGEVLKLTASDAEANDQFGWSVAISNDSVVISAPYEGDNGVDLGAVYVFHRTTGNMWKLSNSDADDGDRFGYSISISINGDYVVVGAPFEDSTGTDLGVVYIF